MDDGGDSVGMRGGKSPVGKREHCARTPVVLTKTKKDAGNEKYYKKFDFFYRRTAFRTMTEYYKGLFRPTLDRWREQEKKISLAALENPSGTISDEDQAPTKTGNSTNVNL